VHLAGDDPALEPEVNEAAVNLVGKAFDELAGARLEGTYDNEGNEDATVAEADDVD